MKDFDFITDFPALESLSSAFLGDLDELFFPFLKNLYLVLFLEDLVKEACMISCSSESTRTFSSLKFSATLRDSLAAIFF